MPISYVYNGGEVEDNGLVCKETTVYGPGI